MISSWSVGVSDRDYYAQAGDGDEPEVCAHNKLMSGDCSACFEESQWAWRIAEHAEGAE